ncbi:MAG: C4-type zinc ribbon domain-containing protein [Candidatus Eisenbacteria bacterium]
MHADLDRLVRAQELDRALADVRGRIDRLAPRRKAADDLLGAEKRALAEAEERAKALALAKRVAEKDAETVGEQERKYQTQLTQVKKNDEYAALLSEIAAAQKRRSELETVVLEKMDEEGRAAGAIAAAKAALAAAEKEAAEVRAGVAADEAVLRTEEGGIVARRDGALGQLPPALRTRYEKLLINKKGRAVSELWRDVCTACGAHMPPQKAIAVRRGESVVDCPDCGRILVPAAPAAP